MFLIRLSQKVALSLLGRVAFVGTTGGSTLDDILVASGSREEHLQLLRALIQCPLAHGLVINPAKSLFGKAQVLTS